MESSEKYKDYRGVKSKGIYVIKNTVNNKIYVGSSSTGFSRRWSQHKTYLRGNKHHSRYLQNAWNKYGESVFEFSVLEEIPEEKLSREYLKEREEYWFKLLEPFGDRGYNIAKDADRPNPRQFTFRDRIESGLDYLVTTPDKQTTFYVQSLSTFCEMWPEFEIDSRGLTACARGEKAHYKGWTCVRANPKNRIEHKPFESLIRYVVYSPEGERFEVYNLTEFCNVTKKDQLENCQSSLSACACTVANPDYKYKVWHCKKWTCYFVEDDPVTWKPYEELAGYKKFILHSPSGEKFETCNLTDFANKYNLNRRVLEKCASDKYPNSSFNGWTCELKENFKEISEETVVEEPNFRFVIYKIDRQNFKIFSYYLIDFNPSNYIESLEDNSQLKRHINKETSYRDCFCMDFHTFTNLGTLKINQILRKQLLKKSRTKEIPRTKPNYSYTLTSPEGTVHNVQYLDKFAEQYNLNRAKLSLVANGKRKHHKNWTVTKQLI